MKPLIGITTYGAGEKTVINPAFDVHFATPALYVDAIRRAGGAAALLPTGEDDIDPWLSTLDGVVMSGGADICPSRYDGDTTHPSVGPVCPARDRAEIALTRALLKHGKIPVLFVCRGMQILNVTQGGTLHEHITDLGKGDIHRDEVAYWAKQPVELDEHSVLARAAGQNRVTTMSGHHQGVKTVGKGLRVLAKAEDGIVEAMEVEGHSFALAVQWHPEASAAEDQSQQNIFDAFIAAALAYKQS